MFVHEVDLSLDKKAICIHTCTLSGDVSCRLAEQVDTKTVPLNCTNQIPQQGLTQRLTCVEPDGYIPLSGGHSFTLSSPLTSPPAFLFLCRDITHLPPAPTKPDVTAKLVVLLDVYLASQSQSETERCVL